MHVVIINFPLNDAWGFGIDFQEFMICDSVKNRHSLTLKFSLKETLFFAILSIVFLSVVYLTIERASYL